MDHTQDTDDDETESAQLEKEPDTESDDDNSETSKSSNEKRTRWCRKRTEVLGNKQVTFNTPATSEENTTNDDIGTSSE